MHSDQDRYAAVIADVDRVNAEDPRSEIFDGEGVPKELIYARRMTETLSKLYPEASELLKIAARAQHIRRWSLPRDQYPLGRTGYNTWRIACRKYHAALTADIMTKHGYSDREAEHVGRLIQKQNLKSDPDSQRLEDVVGVVFVEHYLEAFSKKHDEPKLVSILKKTTRKLSAEGLQAVAALKLSPRLNDLVQKALSSA